MRRGRSGRDRGATIVEFAIVAPLFLLLVFGAIDFGWALSQNIDLKNATREGARLAVVNGSTGSATSANLATEIVARAAELKSPGVDVRIVREDANGDADADDIGDKVVVCLRYPLRSLSGVTGRFLSGTLRSKATMRMEKVPSYGADYQTANWSGACTAE